VRPPDDAILTRMTSKTATAADGWDDDQVAVVHQTFGLALNAAAAMEKSVWRRRQCL
jgi:hypothetical protein